MPDDDHPPFPWTLFTLSVVLQTLAWGTAYALCFPGSFRMEVRNAAWCLIWIPVFGLALSAFEYFYHRYLLHEQPLRWFRRQCLAHRNHHGITNITASVKRTEPDKPAPVRSKYAIEKEGQDDDRMFPIYALSIFFLIFLPGAGLLKLVLPGQPLVLSMMAAVLVAYVGYEAIHALLHLPYEKYWQAHLHTSRHRHIWRRIYMPHVVHHYRMRTNMAVWGFYTVPIWDMLFGTYVELAIMPLPGAEITYNESKVREPVRFIRWLDGLAKRASLDTGRHH